jgi:hypothetical protein
MMYSGDCAILLVVGGEEGVSERSFGWRLWRMKNKNYSEVGSLVVRVGPGCRTDQVMWY